MVGECMSHLLMNSYATPRGRRSKALFPRGGGVKESDRDAPPRKRGKTTLARAFAYPSKSCFVFLHSAIFPPAQAELGTQSNILAMSK